MNVILLLIFAFLVYILWKNNTIFPFSFIFSLFWFLNIFSSEIFFSDLQFSTEIYLFFMTASFSVFLGEFLFAFKNSKNKIDIVINENISKLLFYIFLSFAFVFPIESLLVNGISLSTLLNFETLLEVNNSIAVSRYEEEVKTSIISQFTLIFVYLTPLWAGFLSNLNLAKSNKFLYLSLLPSIFVLVTQNTKLVFIAGLFLFLVGRLTYFIIFKDRLILVKPKFILNFIVGFFVFYFLVVLSFIMRVGEYNETSFESVNAKVASYIAHVPAFDIWLNETYDPEINALEGGTKTFYGIANFLGIKKRIAGIFSDDINIVSNKNEILTNVYTVFRYHLEDFGYSGTFVFLFFIGLIFSFSRFIKRVSPHASLAIIACLLFYVFDSFVSSIWAYISFILVFVVFYFALKISCKKVSNDQF
ncbi:O-antigen polymerase [Flavobacterium columnare]|uniref:O-antigen polymerase n=1 Tax=Flavobacterium columnare TaxID=996 RepID=UPI004034CB7B